VDSVYKQAAARTRIKNSLDDEDIMVAGGAILALAKKLGKGWFALLLSEKLTAETNIPEYILRALAFAGDALPNAALKRAGMFRLKNNPFGIQAAFPPLKELEQLDPDAFLKVYRKSAPKDLLSTFLTFQDEYLFL
jgi:hypothetical protein